MLNTRGVSAGSESVLVIGAGIQGSTLALALAERGVPTVLLDGRSRPLAGASLRNEGKIHLGFVYALDDSGVTTSQLIEGALSFTPLIESWCGELDWESNRSAGFIYAVMDGGLAGPDQLEDHYTEVCRKIEAAGADFGTDYLGGDLPREVTRGRGPVPGLKPGLARAWFGTQERSIDPRFLCHELARAIEAEPLIEVLPDRLVESVARTAGGFRLGVSTPAGPRTIEAERVVNCAWEGAEALDRQVFEVPEPRCYRVKHQVVVRGEAEEALVPTTMVQGPYGDIVPWPNGDVYISWYPVSRTYFGLEPEAGIHVDEAVAAATLAEIGDRIPGIRGYRVVETGPGHIVASATSDIDDLSSGLHSRRFAGAGGADGWWSLSAGKLTTAPLASERCAALITDSPARL